MKKYNLNLKENEELITDCDDLMEKELSNFKKSIKGLSDKKIKQFENWIKVYKLLNYDIIEGLEINKVYKFNDYSAVVELTFRGSKEYDLLNLNPETMTVACMNVKSNAVRPYVVRRLLVPNTVEEALSFAKSELPKEGIASVATTIKDIEEKGDKYDVTESLNLSAGFKELEKEETKQTKVESKPAEQKIETDKIVTDESDVPYSTASVVLNSIRDDGSLDIMALLRNLR